MFYWCQLILNRQTTSFEASKRGSSRRNWKVSLGTGSSIQRIWSQSKHFPPEFDAQSVLNLPKIFQWILIISICHFQHMGSKESVAAKIDADTRVKIDEMNQSISTNRPVLIQELLDLVYDIKPELHKNMKLQLENNWIVLRVNALTSPTHTLTNHTHYQR